MSAYWALYKIRFIALIQYRSAALTGMVVQLFWGAMLTMIFTAYYKYGNSSTALALSMEQTISYIWLAQAMLRIVPWHSDAEIDKLFHDGNIAYELTRPIDLYTGWFFRCLALRTAPVLLAGIPLWIISWAFMDLHAPPNMDCAIRFAFGLVGACFVSTAYTTLITVINFWTTSSAGISRLMPYIVGLFSGIVVPLPLLPEWIQPLFYYQPFRALFDTPVRLYLGQSTSLVEALVHQVCWVLIFIATSRLLLKRILKHVTVQGG